jgi:hypothetical protein
MKKVLVLYFSQSGQLKTITDLLTTSFRNDSNYSVHFEELKPVNAFPFPWTALSFFNAFPETFHQVPIELQPLSLEAKQAFDLIIVAYQPWFLTPSPPIASFLQSQEGKQLLAGKNIVTILGCRNMWLGAQEKVKLHLADAKANLVGNIALVDNSGNITSVITILRWMLTGKKEAFWFFPKAGIQEKELEPVSGFGSIVKNALEQDEWKNLQTKLNAAGALDIKPNLVLLEKRGTRAFPIWAKFIANGGSPDSWSRKFRVYIYMILLPTVVFILSPILSLVSFILLKVKKDELQAEVDYYLQNKLR